MIIHKIKTSVMRVGENLKGKQVYFANQVQTQRTSTKEVEQRIVNRTALSKADIRAAITALAEIIKEELAAGRTVDLADLGAFKVLSIGKRMLNEKDVTVNSLKEPRIQFIPKKEMKEWARQVERSILHGEEMCTSKPKKKKKEDDPIKPDKKEENPAP